MRNKLLLSLFLIVLMIGAQGKFTKLLAQPSVEYSYTGVCVGSPTVFTVNTAITNVGAVQIWNWNFGDGNFSNIQNPTHTFAGFGNYTVTLTITDTNGLVGSVAHVVTIQKLPIANFAYSTPNCSNDSVQFTDLSSTEHGFIRYWVWNFGDGSTVDTVFFPFGNPNVKHVFPSVGGTFIVTLSITNSDSCKNSVSLPVDITPSPIANFFFTGRCEDQVVQFTDASFANGAGNVVAWNWNFGDPISGINNVSNLKNPTHVFQNQGTYTVLLLVTNFNNCTDTISKQVVINPHPPVDFIYTSTCLNELTYFNPDTTKMNQNAIAFWLWDFGDGLTSNARNTAHSYIAPGTYTVTLTVTDTLGCMNVITHQVVVNALPFAHFNAGASNCAGSTVFFNDQSSTSAGYIIRWDWDFGDGNTQTVLFNANPSVQHVYALPGTYNVKLTVKASDSCTQFEIQAVIIHPNPVANFDFTVPTCLGTAVDFTDISQLNGAGSIVQWQWDFGDPGSGILNFTSTQNPSHLFSAAGTFSVKLVVSSGNGCTDTITRNVIVKPLPPVDFNTTHNCQNNAVIFTPDPLVMNLAVIPSFFWEFGDGVTSTLSNPTHIYTVAGTYFVTLTVVDTAGCTNNITKPIAIVAEPNANFSYSQPACKQSEVTFTNLSSAPTGYIVKCEWNFGDGNNTTVTTLASVTHTYQSYATFNVTLTVTTNDSCKRTIILPVTVLPNPLANFSYLTSCVNTPVQFNDLSQPGTGALAGWNWNFGDPPSGSNNVSTIPAPTHLFNAGGTYVVTLIVSNSGGCTDTIQKNVLVHGLPTVDFTSSPGCVNDSTHFVSSTFVNAAAVVSRLWNFGDGFTSPDIDPYHIYAASGSFTVTLTVTDTAGCINIKTHSVSIVPPPTSLFQISVQTCANTPVFFTNQSSTPGGTITSYFWEFGDGNDTLLNAPSSGSISHTYIVGGNYTVKLTIHTSLGCENTSQKALTISASPLALFSYDNTCAGKAVNFNDLSQLNSGTMIVNWFWDFGDPGSGIDNTSNLQNPLHIYNTPGTYTVLLEVDNASGCPDTVSKIIVINPKPPVDYSWANTCLGNPTQFTTNTTVTNIAAVSSYDWDFGDGTAHNTSQQDPIHAYSTTGNFTVILTITDTAGCENSVSHVVTISPQPSALFSFASACLGASTYFTDHSFTSSGEPITAWHWDFGDPPSGALDTSNIQNPAHIYNTMGVYTVSLIVTSQNGCQDTTTMTLQVFGNPHAAYTYTAAPCNGGAVYFQDSSYSQQSTIVGWNWEFEPNSYSTLQNPVYVFYAVDSCYDVRLIVTDVRGCVDTTFKNVCVPDVYNITFASSTTCFKDTTYFTPQLLSPSTDSLVFFSWNFGDPTSGVHNTSALKLPFHYYAVPGTYTISLEATDINNCVKKVYQDLVVLPLPVPAFSYTEGICDSTISFKQSSSGSGSNILQWIWNYGDGTIDTVNAPASADLQHLYLAPGLYVVNLTVTNANGCTNMIADSNVLVKPCIKADFNLIDTLICQNNKLSFADSSSSGLPTTEWYWNFGDGKDTTYYIRGNPINHVFETAGTFKVTMRITTNVAGQDVSDSTHIMVFVNPTPLPDFTYGLVCYLQDAVFENMTSGNGTKISNYTWNFGEPTSKPNDTSSLKNPTHLYNAPGTYDVKLVTKNTIGCSDSVQKSLIVYGLPDANYSYTLSCAGDKTAFNDLSVEAVAPIIDWQWTYNDNTGVIGRRSIQNPEYIFTTPGDYLVNLMVTDTNGCYDTINQKITTWSIPTTIFTYADNFNDVQGQLQFTNTSIDATKYYWTFGNGDDSYSENPVAFYQNDGTYNIMLVTWNDKNCSDTLTLEYKFMVKGLYIPNAFSPSNPKTSVQLLKPVGINLKEYRFEVYDRWGNLLWWTDKLDASGRPTEGWDGRYNGTLLPEGPYVWKATGIFKDGTIWEAENIGNNDNLPQVKTGTATMIK